MSAPEDVSRQSSALPRSLPSAQGVDARAILRLLDAIEASGLEFHSLMVLRHGTVIAEGWWAPYTAAGKNLVYSLSKSFTATAVGMAVDEGALSLDERVIDRLSEFVPADHDDRYNRYLLRHALSMSSGHGTETLDRLGLAPFADGGFAPGEPLRAFFALPPEREPGSIFAYNQMTTYSAARSLGVATGHGLQEWLQPRLFGPFGADEVQWMTFDDYEMAFSGIHVRTETIAKLGQLMLQRGRWGHAQLVSQEWVDEASSPVVPNDAAHLTPGAVADENSDWQQGYGFQFWQSRHGYRGDGAYGQFALVWPDEDVVVVATAEIADMQAELTLLVDHLLPAMSGPPSLEVEDELAQRLSQLALRLPDDDGGIVEGEFELAPVERPAVPGLSSVRLAAMGADGWIVTFVREQDEVSLPIGRGTWAAGDWPTALTDHDAVPFVSTGGVDAAGGFLAELRMIQTPHTLLLRIDPAGVATVDWRLWPLRADGPDGHALPSRFAVYPE